MIRNKLSWIVYVIIGLAVIGFLSQLFTSPANFFKSIIFMIGASVIIFAAIYFIFIKSRNKSNDTSKYKQAVKQSKLKYKPKKPQDQVLKQSTKKKRKTNKRASHLRVIEGNKSKRKDRATY